ncbi:Planctomycete cytochrome C [Planctomycetes bacterium Pan216]|uniref:Planctomycete cytochrome C n=1 Tax=Kolteria novifilia TaxID=2527975 RepID=A0A518BBN8_9BACT|nr:Planctomycete cytochrome C [Planctomycetes bacterium Pan216]
MQRNFTHVLLFLGALPTSVASAEAPIDFNRDIRPILSNTCFHCHGMDEATREADLRLDTKEGAFADLGGYHPIVSGKSDKSELFRRIVSADDSEKMPPPDSGKELSDAQIELIRRWIDQGAPWKGHWSFEAPKRPTVPEVKPTATSGNAIDRFIHERLASEGLEPAEEATKEALLRRATFDLTGLPPTIEEIDRFLADDSPDAYEKAVDRLLESPRYGEHMARYWLDAARYGDTHGLHLDNERSIWPYREWVIKAFNNNMPFDQFTVEQLAGDLLFKPNRDQMIATGFNRCNVTTSEGGAIAEEFRVRYAIDRVETTGTVFMGLTVGCAVCHDHKYDPISQKEFYQLFAYFNNLAEPAMDRNKPLPPPTLMLPTPDQQEAVERYKRQIALLDKAIDAELASIDYSDPAELVAGEPEPREYVWFDDSLPEGAKPLGNENEKSWRFVGGPKYPVYCGKSVATRKAKSRSQHYFQGVEKGLLIGESDKLFIHVYLDPQDPPRQVMLQFNDGTWEHRAYWGEDLIEWGEAGTVSRHHAGPLPKQGEWVRLEVDARTVGLKPGTIINGWACTQFDGTVHWDKAGIVSAIPQGEEQLASLAAWEKVLKGDKKKLAALPKDLQNVLKVAKEKRSDAQKKTLTNYFIAHVHPDYRDFFGPLAKQSKEIASRLDSLEKSIPGSLVMKEAPTPRDAFVLIRGEYDKHGEKVSHGVPAALPPLPEHAPKNRLALARWLVDPSHPLTARVTVNRYWQHLFGTGIVKTSEDFGSQGEWPSHPELLDWLAVEFVESGWDVKQLLKLIVTSSTYRQSSRITPEKLEKDPDNRLLSRGPRFRLDAEMIRDQALALSGLMIDRVGGPSVKPYQPSGVWKAVGYTSSNTAVFKQDKGDAVYRRSLYTFWKRTAPPPSMATFDAPTRESCTVRRSRTNTPLQALVLLNDVQFVEAARNMAYRVMVEGGDSPDERIVHAFRLATGRRPDESEVKLLRQAYESQLADYRSNPASAESLTKVGDSPRPTDVDVAELAAWTTVSNLILNLDETITKG